MDGLAWLGLNHDEFFRQSEHVGTHKKYLQTLIDKGLAYISKEKVEKEGDRTEVIRFKNPNKKIIFNYFRMFLFWAVILLLALEFSLSKPV